MLSWRLLNSVRTPEDVRVFEAMYELYEASFPEDSERESKDLWKEVLNGNKHHGYRLEFIVAEHGSEVAGAIAYEYYPASRCGLLTFVFVGSAYRQGGIARELTGRAHARLTSVSGGKLRFLFAEAEDPVRVASGGIRTSIDPELRLRILSRLGARVVNIQYVQPALGPGKRAAEHLMLLLLAPQDVETLQRQALEEFLREFYASLYVEEKEMDTLLGKAFAEIPGDVVRLTPLA
jgi:hypothetical protein